MKLKSLTTVPIVVLAYASMLIFSSCAEPTAKPESLAPPEPSNVSSSGTIKFDGEIISVPSPVQIANLIQKNNIAFNQEWLHNLQSRSRYINETKKALNMGIYGSDLAYIANYNLGQMNNDYFEVIAQLGSELNVIEDIDKQLMTKLTNNLDNRDSLLRLNADFFRSIDSYLKSNDRYDLSSFILIGGWVESLNLASKAAQGNEALRTRLGEQKYAAPSILKLAAKMNDPAFAPVKTKLEELCNALNALESTYSYRQPINDQREKKTYLRSQTSVKVTDEELANLTQKINAVRTVITE